MCSSDLAPVLPAALRGPLDLLPETVPAMQPSPKVTPARGVQRGRVAFLVGCAQQALAPNFNAATLRVLARNGIEVVIPDGQGCCGAAALHTGLTALIAATEQGRDCTAASLTLWREFDRARCGLLALTAPLSVRSEGEPPDQWNWPVN